MIFLNHTAVAETLDRCNYITRQRMLYYRGVRHGKYPAYDKTFKRHSIHRKFQYTWSHLLLTYHSNYGPVILYRYYGNYFFEI